MGNYVHRFHSDSTRLIQVKNPKSSEKKGLCWPTMIVPSKTNRMEEPRRRSWYSLIASYPWLYLLLSVGSGAVDGFFVPIRTTTTATTPTMTRNRRDFDGFSSIVSLSCLSSHHQSLSFPLQPSLSGKFRAGRTFASYMAKERYNHHHHHHQQQQRHSLLILSSMQHSNSETNGEKGVGDYRLDEASSRIRDYVVNGTVFGDTDVLLGLNTGKLDPTSGLPDGFGRLEYTSGAYDCKVYEGNWSNGEWDGYGQVSVTDGGFYQGEFLSGRFHGEGNLTYSDGAKYSGNFVRGERSGTKCTMNFNDGSMYRGVFVNDYPRDGFYTFPDGGYIQTKWIEKQGIDGCDESYLGGNYSSLPNGWKVLIHSAQPYYVNVRNGTSQWERPPVEYRTSRWERLPVEYIGTTNGTPLMHFASRLHRLISYGIVKDAKDALDSYDGCWCSDAGQS